MDNHHVHLHVVRPENEAVKIRIANPFYPQPLTFTITTTTTEGEGSVTATMRRGGYGTSGGTEEPPPKPKKVSFRAVHATVESEDEGN